MRWIHIYLFVIYRTSCKKYIFFNFNFLNSPQWHKIKYVWMCSCTFGGDDTETWDLQRHAQREEMYREDKKAVGPTPWPSSFPSTPVWLVEVDPFALWFSEGTFWQVKPLWVKLSFCVISIKGSSARESPDVTDLTVLPSFWDSFSEISLLFNQ